MKKTFTITAFALFAYSAISQEVLRIQNGGSITIQNGVTLVLQGGVTLENGSDLQNSGMLFLKNNSIANVSNWTDNSVSGVLSGNGVVIFNSDHAQQFLGATNFYNLAVNTNELTLNNSLRVANILRLVNGKITTGTYYLFLDNASASSLETDAANATYANSWVNGLFRRSITTNTSSYDFPVGTSTRANLLKFLNNNITGPGFLTASFGNKPGTDAGLSVVESGLTYTAVNNGGVWYLVPSASPSSGNYALQLYFNGFTGLADNQFGILRRPDASSNAADWGVPAGSSLEPFNASGRKVSDGFARRVNISDFSQLGIGQFTIDPPVFAGLGTEATINCPATPSFSSPTASDACGAASITYSDVTTPGSCPSKYSTTRTWTATGSCGKTSTASQTITVTDATPPTIGAAGIESTIYSTATPLFTPPTASDACGGATVEQIGYDITASGNCANNYSVRRIWRAVDACSNVSGTVGQTINVVDVTPTISVTPSSQTKFYGYAIDQVTVAAADGDSPGSDLNISVTYTKNGGGVISGLPAGLSLLQTSTQSHSRTWSVTGCILGDGVGLYSIRLAVTDQCGAVTYSTFTINVTAAPVQPVSDAYYIGSCFYWTSGGSSSATLTLVASLKNHDCGDIRTAKVSFYVRNGTALTPINGAQNLPVGLVNPDDKTVGTASATVQYNIGGATALPLDIAVVIGGNYAANDPATDKTIMIAVPVPGGQICGGGEMANSNSAGYLKGAPSPPSYTNFSFFVQYNKSMKNMQGAVEVYVRSYNDRNGVPGTMLHTYKIKSNAISTLAVNQPSQGYAQFSGKANVVEIVDGYEQGIEGNCIMQLDLFDGDYSSPALKDQFAVTIYRNRGGVWFSSYWNGIKTVKSDIWSGNVAVTGAVATITKASPEARVSEVSKTTSLNLVAFPNPSYSSFMLEIKSDNKRDLMIVKIVDMYGRLIQVFDKVQPGQMLKVGNAFRPGVYMAELIQGDRTKQVKLVKQ